MNSMTRGADQTTNGGTQPVDKLAYRINEAAAALGLSRTTLYGEMQAGRLKSVWLGGRRLILRADLLNFVASSREQ